MIGHKKVAQDVFFSFVPALPVLEIELKMSFSGPFWACFWRAVAPRMLAPAKRSTSHNVQREKVAKYVPFIFLSSASGSRDITG